MSESARATSPPFSWPAADALVLAATEERATQRWDGARLRDLFLRMEARTARDLGVVAAAIDALVAAEREACAEVMDRIAEEHRAAWRFVRLVLLWAFQAIDAGQITSAEAVELVRQAGTRDAQGGLLGSDEELQMACGDE